VLLGWTQGGHAQFFVVYWVR